MPPLQPPRSSAAPLAIALILVGLVVAGGLVSMLVLRGLTVTQHDSDPPSTRGAPMAPIEPYVPKPDALDFRDVARPLVVDLNKDGTEDLLVVESFKNLVAVNGKGGPPLWKLETSKGTRGYQSFSYLADSRLVIVDSVDLQLLNLATGKVERKVSLDDKAILPCTAPPGSLRILLNSDEVAKVDPKSGKSSLEPKGAPCEEAPSNFADRSRANARRMHPIAFLPPEFNALRCGSISVTGTYTYFVPDPCQAQLGRLDEGKDAIDPDAAIPMAGGFVLVGSRKRGRRVGVVGRVENKRLVWLDNASSAEPSEQVEGKLTRVAISGEQVAVISSQKDGDRLTSFDAKSGKRLLDVKLPSEAVWLTVANRHWVVVLKKQIVVVDPKGKLKTLYE